MGKLTTYPPFVGTRHNICIYKMYGRYYIRSASTLDGKRVKQDPKFRKTMQYAALLSKASRIGSVVYNELPLHRKKHTLYRKITGEAMTWLKYQWEEGATIDWLLQQYVQQPTTIRAANSVSLRPSYRRKTQRIKKDRRRKKPLQERVKKTERMFSLDYHQRLHQKLRRRVNERTAEYDWAE